MNRTFKALFLGVGLSLAAASAHAVVIFDFECDDPTCGGDTNWGGFWTFQDAAVTGGGTALGGAGDILSFSFTSSDKGGISWTLADLSNGHALAALAITFNGAADRITTIDGGSPTCDQAANPCAGFNNNATGNGFDFLATAASIVGDFGNQSLRGAWIRRAAVPEPTTIGLLGLSLLGLGLVKRKIR